MDRKRAAARELAARLHTMTETEVRQFVQELPAIHGVLKSRDVYVCGDLVIKLAPGEGPACQCFEYVNCYCYDEDCSKIHPEDPQECFCHRKNLSESYGSGQNEAEAALWRELAADVRQYFAEVYASSGDGLWLIQEKVIPLMGYEDVPSVLYDVADRIGVGDVKQANVGHRLEGSVFQPVIFDYGVSQVWQEMTGETDITLIAPDRWTVVHLAEA